MEKEMKMTIKWPNWRIISNQYCFVVGRKLNPTRWKAETYHNTLARPCQSLIENRIRSETATTVIDAICIASVRPSSLRRLTKLWLK
jgi:hypothetical protein